MITSYKQFEWFHLKNSWDTFPIHYVYHAGTIRKGDKIDIKHSGSVGENQLGKGFYLSTSRDVARHHGGKNIHIFKIKSNENLLSWYMPIPAKIGKKLERLIVKKYKKELEDIESPYYDAVGFSSAVVGSMNFGSGYLKLKDYFGVDEITDLLKECGVDGWWYTPILNGKLMKYDFDFVIINPDILEWVDKEDYSVMESHRIPNLIYWMNWVWDNLKDIKLRGIKAVQESDNLFYHTEDYSTLKFKLLTLNEGLVKRVKNILSQLSKDLLKVNIYMIYYLNSSLGHFDLSEVVFKSLYTQRVSPQRYVYHCSPKENRESIMKNGLIPKGSSESKEWGGLIYLDYPPVIFATNKGGDSVWTWRSGKDLWRIDTQGLNNKWWYDLNFFGNEDYQQKHIMTFEPIPPSHIEMVNETPKPTPPPKAIKKDRIMNDDGSYPKRQFFD